MFFKIQCYIIDIKNNDIWISISNKEELTKFQTNLIKLYKNIEEFNYNNNIFKLKVNKQTKFNINFIYNNIKELKGCSVTISGQSKYYCFSYNDEILNELTNTFNTIKKIKKGYILVINKINN
jgi:hypothetical protein